MKASNRQRAVRRPSRSTILTPDTRHLVVSYKNLEKRFGGFAAVDRISFSVNKGEIFGFLGPNGAGTSTTIRMLCGIITPTGGAGWVAGFDLFRYQESIKHAIGYMSQRFSLYLDMTPWENIRFYLGVYDIARNRCKERIEWVLTTVQFQHVRNRLTRDLPLGWRQRLALGCALLHQPKILFLNEPTSGVDPITRRHFWDFIGHLTQASITIFVTTHYVDEARHCDRLVMINQGKIVAQGSPAATASEYFPHRSDADLNDVFIRLMTRG